MCANMEIYNKVRSVPAEAKKPILAGRLKGKTDINPMWRIKKLTEIFGICGFGWKTKMIANWLEEGADGEVSAHVRVELYVRDPETKEWSDAIEGIGGAMYITNEKNGKYTDDDCYKKAYTDAISIACKALGFAADVYYDKDISKYDAKVTPEKPAETPKKPQEQAKPVTPAVDTSLEAERQWAINLTVTVGVHAGKTLGAIYKTDKAVFDALANNPPSIEIAKACTIIREWVASK